MALFVQNTYKSTQRRRRFASRRAWTRRAKVRWVTSRRTRRRKWSYNQRGYDILDCVFYRDRTDCCQPAAHTAPLVLQKLQHVTGNLSAFRFQRRWTFAPPSSRQMGPPEAVCFRAVCPSVCVYIARMRAFREETFSSSSGMTIISGPPGKCSLLALVHLWTSIASLNWQSTALQNIHNSGHFGPPLPFWAPGPRGCQWLVMPLPSRLQRKLSRKWKVLHPFAKLNNLCVTEIP